MGGRGRKLWFGHLQERGRVVDDDEPQANHQQRVDDGDSEPLNKEPDWALSRDTDRRYEIQGRGDFGSGRTYALLEATGREWRVITRPATEFDVFAENPADRFGMDEPTLSWAKDGKAVHIYVDGMITQEFLDHLGIEIDLQNTTTTSKRLSRLFRPQAATSWFDADDIAISYGLSQPKFQRVSDPNDPEQTIVEWGTGYGSELPPEVVEKVWDGAGVVSREMLLKMIAKLPTDMEPRMRAKTIRELRHAKRVEFTLMTEDGQLKGHAVRQAL